MPNEPHFSPDPNQAPDITKVAALIGDAARANMLIALLGGKALTATELAAEADITAATASSHLKKLTDAHLVIAQKQGRHKYFQLRSRVIAEFLETLLNVSATMEHSRTLTGPKDPALRHARICYDHLAGEVGVSLLDALKSSAVLIEQDQQLLLTSSGRDLFNSLGADVGNLEKLRRPVCKNCLDWSERRHHLAGSLGQWVLRDILNRGWARKDLDSRVIRFTPGGLQALRKRYALTDLPA
ncbi:ArsR family transcriptional regulator [Hahella sp. KA22]|uniref:ArsR/SmtB family transcription factor n=1 Tax=Hahella sp. KA22 TaxID=1628392 RepID=UPI000FDF28EB|nr:helix-turn-helix transcriptional regulator [Hahella sp. KA22]AZZ94084.1 transcriptional regulator [Hahella sp. KA22]QAY57458.1 ArsR family transcriptional regulator [Hahella sp. KA22]